MFKKSYRWDFDICIKTSDIFKKEGPSFKLRDTKKSDSLQPWMINNFGNMTFTYFEQSKNKLTAYKCLLISNVQDQNLKGPSFNNVMRRRGEWSGKSDVCHILWVRAEEGLAKSGYVWPFFLLYWKLAIETFVWLIFEGKYLLAKSYESSLWTYLWTLCWQHCTAVQLSLWE